MRRCITCEGILEDHQFSGDSPICRMCVTRLNEEYNVEFSPPQRQTRKEAMVNLILAIKSQAEHDEDIHKWTTDDNKIGGPMAAWRLHWVEPPPWEQLWRIMLEEQRLATMMRSSMHMYTGRYS